MLRVIRVSVLAVALDGAFTGRPAHNAAALRSLPHGGKKSKTP